MPTATHSDAKAQTTKQQTTSIEQDPLNDPAQWRKNDLSETVPLKVRQAQEERWRKASLLVTQGDAEMKKKKFIDAELLYRQALTVDKESIRGWEGLGAALAKQNRVSEAIAAYRVLLYPPSNRGSSAQTDPVVLMRYAILLAQTHQWPEAVAFYEKALPSASPSVDSSLPVIDVHFSPKQSHTGLLMAMAYLGLGYSELIRRSDRQSASESFAQAVRLEPNLAITHFFAAYRPGPKTSRQAELEKAARLGEGDLKARAEKALQAYR